MKLIFAFAVLGFAIHSAFAAENERIGMVSLERTACFGRCPIYTVEIYANGEVDFVGRHWVAKPGHHQKKIAPSGFASIEKKIAEIGFWSFKDAYRQKENSDGTVTMVTDMPTKIVTVWSTTRHKRVEDYYGAPPAIEDLERLIDKVAGDEEWIGQPGQGK